MFIYNILTCFSKILFSGVTFFGNSHSMEQSFLNYIIEIIGRTQKIIYLGVILLPAQSSLCVNTNQKTNRN